MKTDLYVISTYSNMHVGSGEINFGVIDNLIQRDVVTQFPSINSSSLKGSLKEFFMNKENAGGIPKDFVRNIFGSDPNEQVAGNLKQGAFRFFEANLLSLPVRSDKTPYLRAISCEIIKEMLCKIDEFDIKLSDNKDQVQQYDIKAELNILKETIKPKEGCPIVLNNSFEGACIEDFDLIAVYQKYTGTLQIIEKLFGKRLVILHHKDFVRLCDDNHLPVIARNNLDNGISKNLWYEQIVPRFAHFYFIIMKEVRFEQDFDDNISKGLIQIGANASIGYGFSKIQKINDLNISDYED